MYICTHTHTHIYIKSFVYNKWNWQSMLILLKSKQGRNPDYKDIYSMLSPIDSFKNYLLKASKIVNKTRKLIHTTIAQNWTFLKHRG